MTTATVRYFSIMQLSDCGKFFRNLTIEAASEKEAWLSKTEGWINEDLDEVDADGYII